MPRVRGCGGGAAVSPGRASLRLTATAPEPLRGLVPGVRGPRRSVCSLAEPRGSGIPLWAVASSYLGGGLRSGAGGVARLPLSTL